MSGHTGQVSHAMTDVIKNLSEHLHRLTLTAGRWTSLSRDTGVDASDASSCVTSRRFRRRFRFSPVHLFTSALRRGLRYSSDCLTGFVLHTVTAGNVTSVDWTHSFFTITCSLLFFKFISSATWWTWMENAVINKQGCLIFIRSARLGHEQSALRLSDN